MKKTDPGHAGPDDGPGATAAAMTPQSLAAILDKMADEADREAATLEGAAADAARSADLVGGLNGIPGVEAYRRKTATARAEEAVRRRSQADAARAGAQCLRGCA